tara:strand:- start:6 stop:437 length:432 start_codon:yes stop_codon:yes gene_type:complete
MQGSNGFNYGHNALPINDDKLYKLVKEYEEADLVLKRAKQHFDIIKEKIVASFPPETGLQMHTFPDKGMTVSLKQSEERKFDEKKVKELFPLDADSPDCVSVAWKVDLRKFDKLDPEDEMRKKLTTAMTRRPTLAKIKVEYNK